MWLFLLLSWALAEPAPNRDKRHGPVVVGDAGAAVSATVFGGYHGLGQTGIDIGYRPKKTALEIRVRGASILGVGRRPEGLACPQWPSQQLAGCVSDIPTPRFDGALVASLDTKVSGRWSAGVQLTAGARVMSHLVSVPDALPPQTTVTHPNLVVSLLLTRPISDTVDYRFLADVQHTWPTQGNVNGDRLFFSPHTYLGVRFGAAWFPPRAAK